MTEEKKLEPELRFPGFHEPWKDKKLREIADRIVEKNKMDLVQRVLTISGRYGLIDQEEYFKKRIASKSLSNYYLICKDDFAYNKSYSNGYPYGAIKRLKKYNNGVLSSLYICFRVNEYNDIDFFENYFESDKWYREIYKIAVEGARNHGLLNIGIQDFFKTKHRVPSLQEQEKIGKFFYSIDKKLDLQRERVKELKSYKKGMMQRIFDQEIRFKDENDRNYPDWEEKLLDKIIKSIPVKKYKILSRDILDKGNYPVVTQSTLEYEGFSNNRDKLYEDYPVIVFGDHTTVLKYIDYKFIVGGDGVKILTLKNPTDNNLKYLYYTIGYYNIESEGYKRHFTILRNILIPTPSLPEQEKIANFLSAIDRRIELEEEKLELYEDFKKGLMQRMFV